MSAALLVYDITERTTFEALGEHLNSLREHASESCKHIYLVGNKVDLVTSDQSKRKVSYEEGLAFANERELSFMEVSARQDVNIDLLFESLTDDLLRQYCAGDDDFVKDTPKTPKEKVHKRIANYCKEFYAS